MGVKSAISLDELNSLFNTFEFIKIHPTTSGVIDTTYIVDTKTSSYILKRYERDIKPKINQDIKLLNKLKSVGLNVPTYKAQNGDWYLYDKLQGQHPKVTRAYHILTLGRFLAKFHKQQIICKRDGEITKKIDEALRYTKKKFFLYYKKFEFLKDFTFKDNLLIHGDIFKDNTLFDNNKIGVIDFIDSICGEYIFDAAVGLVGFDVKTTNNYHINLFLRSYNQYAPKKLIKKELLKNMKTASSYYALQRVYRYKNTKNAKGLL